MGGAAVAAGSTRGSIFSLLLLFIGGGVILWRVTIAPSRALARRPVAQRSRAGLPPPKRSRSVVACQPLDVGGRLWQPLLRATANGIRAVVVGHSTPRRRSTFGIHPIAAPAHPPRARLATGKRAITTAPTARRMPAAAAPGRGSRCAPARALQQRSCFAQVVVHDALLPELAGGFPGVAQPAQPLACTNSRPAERGARIQQFDSRPAAAAPARPRRWDRRASSPQPPATPRPRHGHRIAARRSSRPPDSRCRPGSR